MKIRPSAVFSAQRAQPTRHPTQLETDQAAAPPAEVKLTRKKPRRRPVTLDLDHRPILTPRNPLVTMVLKLSSSQLQASKLLKDPASVTSLTNKSLQHDGN